MDHDIPDREEIACALDILEVRLARQGQYQGAVDVGSAKERIRSDEDEMSRLESEISELRADLEWALDHQAGRFREGTELGSVGWVGRDDDGYEESMSAKSGGNGLATVRKIRLMALGGAK